MKEVVCYAEESGNLCSIKSIEYIHEGKQYILKILRQLFYLTGNLLVQGRRPDDVEGLVNTLKSNSDKLSSLHIDTNFFEVSFMYTESELDDEILKALVDIWFEFEQPLFAFFKNKSLLIEYREFTLSMKSSWEDIVNISHGYTVYKGVEEDVVWIGKHKELEFAEVFNHLPDLTQKWTDTETNVQSQTFGLRQLWDKYLSGLFK